MRQRCALPARAAAGPCPPCRPLHRYTYAPSATELALELPLHTESCRVCRFAPDGNWLFSAGADRAVSVVDAAGKQAWRQEGAHRHVARGIAALWSAAAPP